MVIDWEVWENKELSMNINRNFEFLRDENIKKMIKNMLKVFLKNIMLCKLFGCKELCLRLVWYYDLL